MHMENSLDLNDRKKSVRQSFLKYPGESTEVDYKKGVKLTSEDPFSLKLIKHILAMSNGGGGYLVIGYEENEHKSPKAETLHAEIAASYDQSTLAQMVEAHVLGSDRVDIVVHKEEHPDTKIIYPIIEVAGFSSRPFFCSKDKANILKAGALYLRIAAARTVRVADPGDWDRLIDICVSKRNDQLLARFAALLHEIGLPQTAVLESKRKQNMDAWLDTRNGRIDEVILDQDRQDGFRFFHWPTDYKDNFAVNDLDAAQYKAKRKNTGWPIGVWVPSNFSRQLILNDGIERITKASGPTDYSWLDTSGRYAYYRNFEEDYSHERPGGALWFDVAVWRIAEIFDHAVALYLALGISASEKIEFVIMYTGLSGRRLSSTKAPIFGGIATVENSFWKGFYSLDLLQTDLATAVISVTNQLFALFELKKIEDHTIRKLVEDYKQSNM